MLARSTQKPDWGLIKSGAKKEVPPILAQVKLCLFSSFKQQPPPPLKKNLN